MDHVVPIVGPTAHGWAQIGDPQHLKQKAKRGPKDGQKASQFLSVFGYGLAQSYAHGPRAMALSGKGHVSTSNCVN